MKQERYIRNACEEECLMRARRAALPRLANDATSLAARDDRYAFMIVTIVGGSNSQERTSHNTNYCKNVAYDIFYVKYCARIIAVMISLFQFLR